MKTAFFAGCALGFWVASSGPAAGEVSRYSFTNCRANTDETDAAFEWNLETASLVAIPSGGSWTLECPIITDDGARSNATISEAKFHVGTCSAGRTAKLCVTFRTAAGGTCGADMNFTTSTYTATSATDLAALLFYPDEPSYLSLTTNTVSSCLDLRGYSLVWQ